MSSSSIYYLKRRDDFDEALLSSDRTVMRMSFIGILFRLVRNPPTILELPEPMWFNYAVHSILLSRLLRILRPLKSRETRIVAYAIENGDYDAKPRSLDWLPSFIWNAISVLLAKTAWRGIDRIAFGSNGAREAYGRMLGKAGPADSMEWRIFQALPTRCPCVELEVPVKKNITFVGALEKRKGIDVLLDAWPAVVEAEPDARLQVVGEGPMKRLVMEASSGPNITYLGSLGRAEIHSLMAQTAVVVLPSQRNGRWREQIGLSIVEGLSHGCRVVASRETGLAEWLESHGHVVVDAPTTSATLSNGILRALIQINGPVFEFLPERDGRIAADDWLCGNV
jgi:glycosyltransferase involved in cell wall biosynthesis